MITLICSGFSCTGEAILGHTTVNVVSPEVGRVQRSFLLACRQYSSNIPSLTHRCFAASCSIFTHFLSTRTIKAFSTQPLLRESGPSLLHCMVLSFTTCRISHIALLNFMRSLLACLFSLSRPLWMAAQTSHISTTPTLSFSVCLLRVHSVASQSLALNTISSIGPIINPQGTPLVTGLQWDFMPLWKTSEPTS